MSIETRRELGRLGEELVFKYCGVVGSSDAYDSEKDGTDNNGQTVEVKTQMRYVQRDLFSIRADKATNLNKCMNADRLIFVEYGHGDVIRIYECTDRQKHTRYTMNNGTHMLGWNVSDMSLLYIIYDIDLAKRMRGLSRSNY